jgi:hypothetical protein
VSTGSGIFFYDINNATGDHIWRTTTSFLERMRITSAGKVGIGIANPLSLLHIYGASNRIKLANSNTGSLAGDGIQLGSVSDGALDCEIWNWENGYLRFATNSTETMRIIANGNIGIGTTAPTSKLQVVGLPVYANNAAAIAGGLTAGALYTTGAGDPRPVYIVY